MLGNQNKNYSSLTSKSKVNSKGVKPTPLHLAVINGDIEIVRMILDKGANINAVNQDGRTPLYNAIENNKFAVTELLLKHRADVNARDNDGISVLHVAAKIGYLQNVEHLLNYGANVNCVCSSRWENGYTPLHVAVEKGNEKVTTLLLSRGANVDVKGEDGITPLHIAAEKGYTCIAEDLLNHGASTHSSTLKEGYTPLHFASELGNEKVVKLLLQHGAKVDNQDKGGKTILYLAVKNGDLTIVQNVLKYCPDINNQSNRSSLKIAVNGFLETHKKIVKALIEYGFNVGPEDANSPELLHTAVEKGYLKIIEDLIKYGAHVNMTTFKGFTPLHSAVINKQEEVAKLLISYEADINAQDKTGKTPISYAIERDDFKMTKLLLTNGAYIKDSPELLRIVIKKGWIEIVEALYHHGADVNTSDDYGRTALHFTADIYNRFNKDVYIKIARLLLSKGANVNAEQKDGKTALHLATENGFTEFVKVLLECGAKVDLKIKSENKTALHKAAFRGFQEIVEIILKFGADVNSRDKDGRTALHIASRQGCIGVVATLLEYGSDINITCRENRTPLEDAKVGIKSYDILGCYDNPCEEVEEVLERHIFKMKTANLYVSKKNLSRVSSFNDFQGKCEKEIASIKSEKIINSKISFYDILAKDTSSLAIYMSNENIVQVLKSGDYKTKFPIYASMIESHFRKGMERKELIEQCNKIFHFIFNNFPELPYVCTEKIFCYLNDKDLRILLDACKPLSISNPNININDV